jgi:AraC-like DNA-binding protein
LPTKLKSFEQLRLVVVDVQVARRRPVRVPENPLYRAATTKRRQGARHFRQNYARPGFRMADLSTIERQARSDANDASRRRDGMGHEQRREIVAPSVQGWVLPHLIAWVESRGVDASPIRRLFGRTRLEDPNVRIREAVTETAWRLAATLTSDDALGVHLAESLPRGALDLIEYALRSSPSLGKGLERLARYGRLLSDRVASRAHRKGEGLLLLFHDIATTPLHPARAEFALAMALKLARDSTGADITPVRVCFAHAGPDNTAEHRRFFNERVRFGAGSNSMSLTASDTSRPMHDADAALQGIIRRRLENALGDRDRSNSTAISTRVRRVVVEHLGQSVLTLEAVATALAVSRRTLTRRLAEERVSFTHILDEVRRDFAYTLLQDRTLSISDIAFFLQYSEPAAFHRSFRRWTGRTPRAFTQD